MLTLLRYATSRLALWVKSGADGPELTEGRASAGAPWKARGHPMCWSNAVGLCAPPVCSQATLCDVGRADTLIRSICARCWLQLTEGLAMSEHRPLKIYVASSWRNLRQPTVVTVLRKEGHHVYDFRNPGPGQHGFSWSEIDPNWKRWTPAEFREALQHPAAKRGFGFDMRALASAEATVLVLPCGRSAHIELGYAVGAGQRTFVLCDSTLDEAELMYLMNTRVCLDIDEIIECLRE